MSSKVGRLPWGPTFNPSSVRKKTNIFKINGDVDFMSSWAGQLLPNRRNFYESDSTQLPTRCGVFNETSFQRRIYTTRDTHWSSCVCNLRIEVGFLECRRHSRKKNGVGTKNSDRPSRVMICCFSSNKDACFDMMMLPNDSGSSEPVLELTLCGLASPTPTANNNFAFTI